MDIWLIRHGETDLNKQGIVQGRGVNSSLNATGVRQAEGFFHTYGHIEFDVIYTSSLVRTHQSVKSFIDKGGNWEQTPLLDEISWGIHEGQPGGSATYASFHRLVAAWKDGDIHASIEKGESPLQVQERLRAFINRLERSGHRKVLICSHGRSMRILLCTLFDEPLSQMDKYPHQNLCLYRITKEDKTYRLTTFNDTSHFERPA